MVLDVQRQEVALNLNSDWGFKFGPVNTLKGFGDAHLTVLTVKGDEGLRFGGLNKRFREYYRQPVNYWLINISASLRRRCLLLLFAVSSMVASGVSYRLVTGN
jgi:hypothetical protein